MASFFFNFDDFETEINRKINSRSVKTELLFKEFLKKVKEDHNLNAEKIDSLFNSLIKLPFNKMEKDYLSHPIRLAYNLKFINKKQTTEDINFALCHNIIENGFLDKVEKKYLGKDEVNKIKILTIDRKKEKEEKYLNIYYDKIENYSEELLIFKSLDKLDNTLLGTVSPFGEYHVHVVKDHVCPRVKKYNSYIAKYLNDLVDYVVANR